MRIIESNKRMNIIMLIMSPKNMLTNLSEDRDSKIGNSITMA